MGVAVGDLERFGHLISLLADVAQLPSRVTYRADRSSHTITQYLGDNGHAELRFNWSCQHPGGLVHYTVRAYDDEGDQMGSSE